MGIKYSVNENFFKSWSKKMAYVLGYIYADGYILDAPSMRGKYISITSIDKESIERIKCWLCSDHKVIERPSQWLNGNLAYVLRIGSHRIYDSLFQHGLYPNKSLTMRLPKIPQKYLMDFVRGYFDGDGCISLYKTIGNSGHVHARKLSVIFTSGSKKFLSKLTLLLSCQLEIKTQKIIDAKTAFQLRYSTTDSVTIYHELYKGCKKGEYLERKHQIFQEFFELHKRRSGEDGQRGALQKRYARVRIPPTPHSKLMYELYSHVRP